MKQWNPPKWFKDKKRDIVDPNYFSRWGKKLDQYFNAPMLQDTAKQMKKQRKRNDEFFHIERSKAASKGPETMSKKEQAVVEEQIDELADAGIGYKVHRPFQPKTVKQSQTVIISHEQEKLLIDVEKNAMKQSFLNKDVSEIDQLNAALSYRRKEINSKTEKILGL